MGDAKLTNQPVHLRDEGEVVIQVQRPVDGPPDDGPHHALAERHQPQGRQLSGPVRHLNLELVHLADDLLHVLAVQVPSSVDSSGLSVESTMGSSVGADEGGLHPAWKQTKEEHTRKRNIEKKQERLVRNNKN